MDGDSVHRVLTSLFLQRVGYHVFSVKTAEDALLILEMTVPLLVITEITLTRMNGIDLLKAVKQHRDCRNARRNRSPAAPFPPSPSFWTAPWHGASWCRARS